MDPRPAQRTGFPAPARPIRWLTEALRAGTALTLLAAFAVASSPLMAQAHATDPELKALIPDEAVAHPEDWAKGQPPVPPTASAPVAPELNPDSPLADIADFTLPWPDQKMDMPELAALPADADAAPALADAVAELPKPPPPLHGAPLHGADRRGPLGSGRMVLAYPDESAAFPERGAFEQRFRQLSTLQALGAKDMDNLAQVAVRAASDRALLERLMHIYGYYDAEVTQTVGAIAPGQATTTGAAGAVSVRFDIIPAARYRFGTIDLGDLGLAGADMPALRKSFAINTGDPLHEDAIPAESAHLSTALGEAGYPFAKLGDPALTVDHRSEQGDLALPVTPGGKYRFGAVNSALPRYLSSHHLAEIARFKPGQTYRHSQVDDLRKAILATGLVSSLTVTPRETTPPTATDPGVVALDVAMTKAPQRTVSGALGYDTGEGARLELGWENRNLFPPEGSLRLRGIAGTDEQLAGATFRRNDFGGRDRALTVDVYADNATLPAYAARTVDFTVTYERQTTLLFQKPWTWSLGIEQAASDEREGVPSGITTGRTVYVTSALPLRAGFDASDDLLDPHRGWRAALRVSPELSVTGGETSTYLRVQYDGSWYLRAAPGLVLASRLRLGSIMGAPLESIAPSRRFYAGGGGSIRGYGYELVGPLNALGEPMGARSLYEFSIEARAHTGLMGGALSLVPFLDAGGADTSPVPGPRDVRYGAGLGVRYQTGFGPIRVDVGTPLNPRPGDSRIGVYVALGQAF